MQNTKKIKKRFFDVCAFCNGKYLHMNADSAEGADSGKSWQSNFFRCTYATVGYLKQAGYNKLYIFIFY